MAEARQPAYDDIRQVMNLTGVDEATARKELEETGGDMTMTINNLLDDLEIDRRGPVVNQVMFFTTITVSQFFVLF